MEILSSKRFKKDYHKKLSKLQARADARMLLFLENPFHPILANHPLHGEWEGYRSINIAGDCRAVYREIKKDVFYFVAIGTHDELYQ